MNDDELLDYALGRHEVLDRRRVEMTLETDALITERVDRLSESLNRLLDDGDSIDIPADLGHRTVAFVARHRRHPTLREQLPVRLSPFRWADFAVAASILIAGLLTLVPAIQRSRDKMNQAGCVFNLQQLGNSLAQYASMNPHLPYPPSNRGDNAHVGDFAPIMYNAGLLHNIALLDCPCNGISPQSTQLVSFDHLEQLRNTNPAKYREMVNWDYAYNVGYRHASGMPGPIEGDLASSGIPVLADQPNHDGVQVFQGNSPNHAGRGQNVLFGDGSVRWFLTRRVSPLDPDLFLNNEHQPLPGLTPTDAVLVPSKMPFQTR